MVSVGQTLLDEISCALVEMPQSRQAAILRRLTDLFISSAAIYSDDQLELFGDVLGCVMPKSDRQALVELSEKLRQIGKAPPTVVHFLSCHDDIGISGPVLTGYGALPDPLVVEIARTKGHQHVLAIASRARLSENVTDALLARGNVELALKLTDNEDARFSELGFVKLVRWAKEHPKLAASLARRLDLPPELGPFLKLAQR